MRISDFENKFNCLVFFFSSLCMCIYCWEQMNTVAGLDPHFVATTGRSILYWSYLGGGVVIVEAKTAAAAAEILVYACA
jgi:hypothetical protein